MIDTTNQDLFKVFSAALTFKINKFNPPHQHNEEEKHYDYVN